MKASVIYSLFVHHMFQNSNCHLHEHVLSSHRGTLLLFHGRVFLYCGSWPPTDLSRKNCAFRKRGMPSCNVSVVCSLFVCPRASLVFSWRQVAALPRLDLWRGDPSASLCTGRCTYGLGAQGHPGLLLPR